MERARRLIGLPVRTPDGQKAGDVEDVVLDETARQLVGLVVVAGSVVRRPRYVARQEIVSITGEAVTIEGLDSMQNEPLAGQSLQGEESPLGQKVVTTGGGGLGRVRDVLLDDDLRSVWGFEISDGLVRDVIEGAAHLPRQLVQRLEEEDDASLHMIDAGDGKPTTGGGEGR